MNAYKDMADEIVRVFHPYFEQLTLIAKKRVERHRDMIADIIKERIDKMLGIQPPK